MIESGFPIPTGPPLGGRFARIADDDEFGRL
jgi:hypothetical protein